MSQRVNVPQDEQEEILNVFPKQTTDRMSAYSCIPAGIRYYQGLLERFPDDVKLIKADQYGIEVDLPLSWYRRPKPPAKKNLTDDQRAAAAARLKASRQKRKGANEVDGRTGSAEA